jgi:hypothetical protein
MISIALIRCCILKLSKQALENSNLRQPMEDKLRYSLTRHSMLALHENQASFPEVALGVDFRNFVSQDPIMDRLMRNVDGPEHAPVGGALPSMMINVDLSFCAWVVLPCWFFAFVVAFGCICCDHTSLSRFVVLNQMLAFLLSFSGQRAIKLLPLDQSSNAFKALVDVNVLHRRLLHWRVPDRDSFMQFARDPVTGRLNDVEFLKDVILFECDFIRIAVGEQYDPIPFVLL